MLKQIWNIFSTCKQRHTEVETEVAKDLFKLIECKANDPSEDRISYGSI